MGPLPQHCNVRVWGPILVSFLMISGASKCIGFTSNEINAFGRVLLQIWTHLLVLFCNILGAQPLAKHTPANAKAHPGRTKAHPGKHTPTITKARPNKRQSTPQPLAKHTPANAKAHPEKTKAHPGRIPPRVCFGDPRVCFGAGWGVLW